MSWEQIAAMASAITTVGGILWRAIVKARKALSDIIANETAFLAKQFEDIKQQQKFFQEQVEKLQKDLNEVKGSLTNNRIALDEFERRVTFSIDKNTEILSEITKSKPEWLSENLIKVSGNKK